VPPRPPCPGLPVGPRPPGASHSSVNSPLGNGVGSWQGCLLLCTSFSKLVLLFLHHKPTFSITLLYHDPLFKLRSTFRGMHTSPFCVTYHNYVRKCYLLFTIRYNLSKCISCFCTTCTCGKCTYVHLWHIQVDDG
jgi:hypothetical protein